MKFVMVNLKAISILLILLVLYISVIYNGVRESFTNKKTVKKGNEEDCGCDDSGDDDDDEDEEDDEEPVPSDSVEVASQKSVVRDSIVIKDTIRRESKIPSTLGFTYLDEQCEVRKDKYPNFPVTALDVKKTEPVTPLISGENEHVNFQGLAGTNISGAPSNVPHKSVVGRLKYESGGSRATARGERRKDDVYSEMFDDSELKPKPDIDSPYGFVYFPNKYWKELQKKLPVCTSSKCKVLPTYTHGAPVDVLDYTQIGSIMPKFKYSEECEDKDLS